ncbi:MAG: hypothetical protein RIF41_00970 [Polyangiaceae bacterium]
MRAYAMLALAATATMASCHLFLESRGLQPGSGGAGGAGTGVGGAPETGGGGVGTTGGGGVGGVGGVGGGVGGNVGGAAGCHVPFAEECEPIDFLDDGPGLGAGGFGDPACLGAGTQGNSDHFGDAATSIGNWMARIEGPDAHLQHCQNARELTITPNSVDDFWQKDANYDEIGPFVFQRVCHAFAMVTRLTVVGLADPPDDWKFHGAGIAVADTTDNAKAYLHLSYGFHDVEGVSETRLYAKPPGSNTLPGPKDGTITADPYLGVCRPLDGGMYFYVANPGQVEPSSWVPIGPANPADVAPLAQTCCVDVGLTAASFVESTLDCEDPVRGQFDWVEFRGADAMAPFQSEADCPEALTELYVAGKADDLLE